VVTTGDDLSRDVRSGEDGGAGAVTITTLCAAQSTSHQTILFKHTYTYIPLTLYPRRGSRGISDIPPRHPCFTKERGAIFYFVPDTTQDFFLQGYRIRWLKDYWRLAMSDTADMTGGKPIAVLLQCISGVSANNPLVAFYDIHVGKREVLFFFVSCRVRDKIKE
jgi:hypothetical protein